MDGVRRKLCVAAVAMFGCAAMASGATFTEGNQVGWTWSDIQGQTFGAGIEPVADPGLAAGDPVYLTSFELTRSGAGYGDPDADVYLAIMPAAFYDWNSAPTTGDAVGISENSYNPSTVAENTVMAFTFDTGLELAYDGVYSAVYVTISGGALTPVTVGSLIADWNEVSPGVWMPDPNYGGTNNWDAVVLYADYDGNGYQEGGSMASDANFLASFSTEPIPEPASAALLLGGTAVLVSARKRRS